MSIANITKGAGALLAAFLSLSTAALAADAAAPAAKVAAPVAAPAAAPAADSAEVAAEPAAEQPAAQPVAEPAAPEAAPQKQVTAPAAAQAAPAQTAATPPVEGLKAAHFALNADVFGADSKPVGKINRISSAANGSVTEIHVDMGKAGGVVIVPAAAISEGGAKVKLSLTADEAAKLPAVGG